MDTVALARGVPSADLLPIDAIRESARRVLEGDAARILSYGTGGGYPPLRELLADRHGVDPSQVIVSTGSLQGFSLVISDIASRVDAPTAIVEGPTYDRPLLLLKDAGFTVSSVDVDDQGLDTDALAERLDSERPDLVYVIPTFQNPSGQTMSDLRRERLVELLAATGTLGLEDDPYGELWFDAPPPASVFSRAGDAPIAYSSSFSKTVSPGLRVGYIVLGKDLAARVERRANDTYISPSHLGGAIVHDLLQRGLVAEHVLRCREILSARCAAMCDAIGSLMPDVTFDRPQGGYFLWIRLPDGVDSAGLLKEASANHGVTFVAGASCGEGFDQYARLAFSCVDEQTITIGIERMARALGALVARV